MRSRLRALDAYCAYFEEGTLVIIKYLITSATSD